MATQLSQTAWQSRRARALRPFKLPSHANEDEFRAPICLTGMFDPSNMKLVQAGLKGRIHGVTFMPMERADKPEQWLNEPLDPSKEHEILVDYCNDDKALHEFSLDHDLVAGFTPGRMDVVTCVGCATCTSNHALKVHEFLSTFDFGDCGLRPPGSTRRLGGLTVQLEMATFGLSPKLDMVNAILEASADRQNNRRLKGQFGGLQIRGFDVFGDPHKLSKKSYQEIARRTGERSPGGLPQVCLSWKNRPLNQFIWQGGLLVDPGCDHKELNNDDAYLMSRRFSRKLDLVDSQFPTVPVPESDFEPGWPADIFGASILATNASAAGPSGMAGASSTSPNDQGKKKKGKKGKK